MRFTSLLSNIVKATKTEVAKYKYQDAKDYINRIDTQRLKSATKKKSAQSLFFFIVVSRYVPNSLGSV